MRYLMAFKGGRKVGRHHEIDAEQRYNLSGYREWKNMK